MQDIPFNDTMTRAPGSHAYSIRHSHSRDVTERYRLSRDYYYYYYYY